MKYITRQLYQDMQSPDKSGELDRRWRLAWESYRADFERDRHRLPPSMQTFAEVTLHDGIVQSVERAAGDSLVLRIDATGNPWGPRGVFDVRFAGVVEADGLEAILGDEWLYEEVHAHPNGFEYQVLLWRAELRIVASAVEMVPVADPTAS